MITIAELVPLPARSLAEGKRLGSPGKILILEDGHIL